MAVGFFLVSEMNDAIRESTVISEGLPYVVLGTPAIKLELSSGHIDYAPDKAFFMTPRGRQ